MPRDSSKKPPPPEEHHKPRHINERRSPNPLGQKLRENDKTGANSPRHPPPENGR